MKRNRKAILNDLREVENKRNDAKSILLKENRTASSIELRSIEDWNALLQTLESELEKYDEQLQGVDGKEKKDEVKTLIGQIIDSRSRGTNVIEVETRSILDATTTAKIAIGTESNSIVGPVRDQLVAVSAGAKMITGLVKDQTFPLYSGTKSLWAKENDAATDGKGELSAITLKPKRLTTQVVISKQLLLQDSVNFNDMLKADISDAICEKLEQTIFGKHEATETIPSGLFTGDAPTNKGVITFKRLVDMLSSVKTSGKSLSYIVSRQMMGTLMSTPKFANGNYPIMEDNLIAGYPVYVTDAVATGLQDSADEYGIVLGDFSELIIAEWGNMDITVDEVTKAGTAEVVLTVNAYYDFAIRRKSAIVTASAK